MPTFTDIATLIPTLGGRLAAGDRAENALAVLQRMTDADVVEVLAETAALERQVEQIQVAASGVIAARSRRESGHSGLAASRGHRSVAALVQDVTGSTKVDADRKVRVGEVLLVVEAGAASASTGADSAATSSNLDRRRLQPWFQPLPDALRDGRLTSAQFDAIRRGLGKPPEIARAASEPDDDFHAAWMRAADHLVAEAAQRSVEELCQQARSIRDVLDPEGARVRHLERFERRSFRTYRSQDGQKRASLVLDDEGDLFLETILAAALRPRRGGPRFVDAAER